MKSIWNKIFSFAVDYMISLLIIICTLLVFTETFSVEVRPRLWPYAAVFTMAAFLPYRIKRGKLAAIFAMLVIAIVGAAASGNIKDSFYNVIRACSVMYEQTYMYCLVEPGPVLSSDATGAMMVICAVFSVIVAWSVEGKSMGLWPGALVTIGILGFTLAVYSHPSVLCMAAVVAGWLALFFVRRFRKNS